jgi:superfamily II DNA helicase RecQ
MYATKAFGMGVDINDIQNVYHYAPTGSHCDYVQEIGRAARKKSMTVCAVVDFSRNDLNFMETLFGMSAIKQWQIRKRLRTTSTN